jgi:hypothetical protein
MRGTLLSVAVVAISAASASAQPAGCSVAEVRRTAVEGRDMVADGVGGHEARDAWNRALDCGGAIAWPATIYSVDARATFVLAFARDAIRVHRLESEPPEAVIPWDDVREIEAGNWVIWFRFRTPVEIVSDRGRRARVKELKVFLYGGEPGELTYYYDARYVGRDWFWGTPLYDVTNLRGIAVGPAAFQRRVQMFLAETFDPQQHITLKQKGRGAGW